MGLLVGVILLAGVAAGPAPDVPPDAVFDLRIVRADGSTTTLRDAVGAHPTIVAFWASYCAPCAAEVPVLNRAAARWRDRGLRVLGVALESDGKRVSDRMREWGIAYDVLRIPPGSGDTLQRLFPRGLPAAAFVARGELTRHDRLIQDEDLPAIVERLLGP